MFTVTVIHEVRWLPNDVESKLAQMQNEIAQMNSRLEIIHGLVDEIARGQQEKIDQLTAALKPEADALEQSSQTR